LVLSLVFDKVPKTLPSTGAVRAGQPVDLRSVPSLPKGAALIFGNFLQTRHFLAFAMTAFVTFGDAIFPELRFYGGGIRIIF